MTDVYKNCPNYENEYYVLRMVRKEDKVDLLKVYSDEKAVPIFNSDNCGGDDFYYKTEKRIEEAIDYWFWEYSRKGFVRWSIISKTTKEAIGTIELFHREANDYFTNCGLLRLDLRSDFEVSSEIYKILQLIIEPTYALFSCDKIATKAIKAASERILALEKLGFKSSDKKLIGHDGTEYDSYFVLNREFVEKSTMKRELGIARCGLACCLCSENVHCGGCDSGDCPDKEGCENRRCSLEKGIDNCFLCSSDCKKGLLSKMKPYGFTEFAKRFGVEKLLDCLETNEKKGVVYHRDGILGDYDDFDDVEALIDFIIAGVR